MPHWQQLLGYFLIRPFALLAFLFGILGEEANFEAQEFERDFKALDRKRN